MIYNLKTDNYKNFDVTQINKAEGRAYFIPFPSREEAERARPADARYNSPLVSCLSGEWDFAFFKKPADLPAEFDSDAQPFDKIPVPSCWQFTGYMNPFYLNVQYMFPCKPPRIPEDEPLAPYKVRSTKQTVIPRDEYNSIGVYRKKFTVPSEFKRHVLSFLGVASGMDLFLNGQFIGYSEGSHNTAEFDISDHVTAGENELIAVVRRWTTGTYLECQDMFRNNGIFRDVLLYSSAEEYIRDFYLEARKRDGKYELIATVYVCNPSGAPLTVCLKTDDGEISDSAPSRETVSFVFKNLSVKEWSAEIPSLYPVIIGLKAEREYWIKKEFGFKTVSIDKNVFLVNGKPVKIKGVNHHDTHPEKGYAVSISDLLEDVLLMKEFNVNAVRTSHYPPDPVFLELCDEYGLYVIDEADIETHGAGAAGRINMISNNLNWKYRYLDRVKRMFLSARNDVCVVMWSLGNESGGWRCQDYCYKYLKANTRIPVHYEAACRTPRQSYDVYSEMYTHIGLMKKRLATSKIIYGRNRPYFLCEYAHAMGVGAGGLEEYMELFYSDDRYMGGCIWEWADHAVYHADGKYKWTYGGDHGEYVHDGNFCVDGLFYPDRSPHTGAYQMKAVYRPLRAKLSAGGITFENTNRFKASDYIDTEITLTADDGQPVRLRLDQIVPPMETTFMPLDFPKGKRVFADIVYTDRDSGRIIAEEQLKIACALSPVPSGGKPECSETADVYEVSFEGGRAVFGKKDGALLSLIYDGKEVLASSPVNPFGKKAFAENIFRAPTDNDRYVINKWRKAGYDKYDFANYAVDMVEIDNKAVLHVNYDIVAKGKKLFKIRDTLSVDGLGGITVNSTLTPARRTVDLPRIGKLVELAPEFEKVSYFGRGERESYPDFKAHASLGNYSFDASFTEPYIRPQESGNRNEVYKAVISDGVTRIAVIATENPLNFNATRYSPWQLQEWKHIEDIAPSSSTVLYVDGFMGGIGSNSCGPRPWKQYRLTTDRSYNFSFFLGREK